MPVPVVEARHGSQRGSTVRAGFELSSCCVPEWVWVDACPDEGGGIIMAVGTGT
jgi:hypothetical protein